MFIPERSITDKSLQVKKMLTSGKKKWLSIQAHDMSINGKAKHLDYESVQKSLDCANKLLKEKVIDNIFFATDSKKLEDYAYKLISDQKAYVLISKDQDSLMDYDSRSIHSEDEMDHALLDWYLVGEADYCMSPSIFQSAYSKTAIARGGCLYINYEDGDKCDVTKAVSNKEYLLYALRGSDKLAKVWDRTTPIPADKVWDTVKITTQTVPEQCMSPDTPTDLIRDYWSSG